MQTFPNPQEYFQTADALDNEVSMWFIAASLIKKRIIQRTLQNNCGGLGTYSGQDIQVSQHSFLDICSGPGNFSNYVALLNPELHIHCLDIESKYLQLGRSLFPNFTFINTDIFQYNSQHKFDFIGLSSAYHHIPDMQKVQFLQKTNHLLNQQGQIIMCEHFLPAYQNSTEKLQAIDLYYDYLIEYYQKIKTSQFAIDKLKKVQQIEKSGQDEFKNSFPEFQQHLQAAQLEISQKIPILEMPTHTNAGSFVLILHKTPQLYKQSCHETI